MVSVFIKLASGWWFGKLPYGWQVTPPVARYSL